MAESDAIVQTTCSYARRANQQRCTDLATRHIMSRSRRFTDPQLTVLLLACPAHIDSARNAGILVSEHPFTPANCGNLHSRWIVDDDGTSCCMRIRGSDGEAARGGDE